MAPAVLDRFTFKIDAVPDLSKLCVKMCSAAATLLPEFEAGDIAVAATALHQETVTLSIAAKDVRTHKHLDEARPRLAHVIYVERNSNETYGVVQFFGAWQFHCLLGRGSSGGRCAILCVLDSLTGEEDFRQINRLGISGVPNLEWGFGEIWQKRLVTQVRQLGISGFSDVTIDFLPAFRATQFVRSTTEVWPFAELPSTQKR